MHLVHVISFSSLYKKCALSCTSYIKGAVQIKFIIIAVVVVIIIIVIVSEGLCFGPLAATACRSVLGKATEPPIA